MSVKLSIVVVNWNAGPALTECVRSIAAGTRVVHEVIVVDNGSIDGSIERLEHSAPGARIVREGANGGFAAGANRGIERALGRHVLLLNPDTRVAEGGLDALVGLLERWPDVGALGCRLVDEAGCVEANAGRFPGFRASLARVRGAFGGAGPDRWITRGDGPLDVDWVSGAFLALAEPALRSGIRLDPGYPLYMEDVDLCRAIRAAGLRVVLVPHQWAVHRRGGSPPGADRRRLRRYGAARYHRKWGGVGGLPLALCYWILSRGWEREAGALPERPR